MFMWPLGPLAERTGCFSARSLSKLVLSRTRTRSIVGCNASRREIILTPPGQCEQGCSKGRLYFIESGRGFLAARVFEDLEDQAFRHALNMKKHASLL